MTALRLGRCRSCRAEVFWAFTESGKRMPIDPVATSKGNLCLVEVTFAGETPHSVRTATPDDPPEHRYVSHFATCPDRDRWRKT